jgi:thiosulfate dehydrogenase
MRIKAQPILALLFAAAALGLAAYSSVRAADDPAKVADDASLYEPSALPTGPVGDAIRLGHDIIANTQVEMNGYVRSDMSCQSCHLNAGTVPHGGSLVGTAAHFPQWNARSKRVITLQDRLAECFLYSMNGHPPKYASKEMIGLVAYIAWLSRGEPILSTPRPDRRFMVALPSASPDVAHGAAIYAQKCSACHQTSGAGISGTFPPLWGPTSFNNGAGMAHIDRMTGWVMYNMPKGSPGTLSFQEAYDVSSFVLSHARPVFDGDVLVTDEALPAKYY